MLGVMDRVWRWFVAGVGCVAVGLALWPTAFVLLPAGVVLIGVGAAKILRQAGA